VQPNNNLLKISPSEQKSDCDVNQAESSFEYSEKSQDYSNYEPSVDEESKPQNDL